MNFLIYLLKMVIFHRKVLDSTRGYRWSCHAKAQAQAIVWSLEMQGMIMDDPGPMVLDISGYVFTLGIKPLVKMGIYRDL